MPLPLIENEVSIRINVMLPESIVDRVKQEAPAGNMSYLIRQAITEYFTSRETRETIIS